MSDAASFLDLPYTTTVVPDVYSEGGLCYLAQVGEMPGCESHGDTPSEARANLREAMDLYITTMLEDGIEPPRPAGLGLSVVWNSTGSASEDGSRLAWEQPVPLARAQFQEA